MRIIQSLRSAGLSLALLVAVVLGSLPASAAPWWNSTSHANTLFMQQWQRTDHELARSGRTWYWGPAPWFDYYEFYRESHNGLRLVQYYDKARAELNQPASGAVTNGLLVVELVGGQRKLGDQPTDNAMLSAAKVPVAGDPALYNAEAPTYASFVGVSTINNPHSNRNADRLGQPVSAAIDRFGSVSQREDLARAYADETRIVQYSSVLGHNIPAVFWNFLNQRGPVHNGHGTQDETIINWIGAMGYPIADPYWVRSKLGGVERDILVQLFERRVLTYTPSNPAGYKVEMGNVGQHYFQWRYPHLGMPWAGQPASVPIAFASKRETPDFWQVYTMTPQGEGQTRVAWTTAEMVPYSWRRSYSADQVKLLVDSRYADGSSRQIYDIALNTSSIHSRAAHSPPNNYNAAVSPDGTKIAFVSDRTGAAQLYLTLYDPIGNYRTEEVQAQLTSDTCYHQTPSWSPDGRSLVWMADCDGDWEVYRGDLAYSNDNPLAYGHRANMRSLMSAQLMNVVNLTNNSIHDQFPRYSPDGQRIAFQSNRDGNYEIYTMRPDGSQQLRLTTSAGDDYAPSWSPDGTKLAFDSNRDGDWEVFTMSSADGAQQTQLTNNTVDDRWNIWWQ